MWISGGRTCWSEDNQPQGSKSRMCLLSSRNSKEISVAGPWPWGVDPIEPIEPIEPMTRTLAFIWNEMSQWRILNRGVVTKNMKLLALLEHLLHFPKCKYYLFQCPDQWN